MNLKQAVARARVGNDPRKGRRMVTVTIATLKQFGKKFVEGASKHKCYRHASSYYGRKLSAANVESRN